jgi:DNA-3-methyladenine glycosylase I
MTTVDVEKLMQDERIIRNKAKIESTINNAQKFIEIQKEFGSFCNYIWSFVGGKPIINTWGSLQEVPATTVISDTLAKDMKKRGFKFLGSTTLYAHMQACGLVNDHVTDCFRHAQTLKRKVK